MKQTPSFSDTLAVARALGRLPEARAPRSLAPAVLRRIGLADAWWRMPSPVGDVFVAHGPAGISLVLRTSSAARFEREFRLRHGRSILPDARPAPRAVRAAIARLGRADASGLRFDLRGKTDFERAVLRKALEIPRGEVRPYGWIAREIGRPDAVRAAGTALAKNPVPLLIPCHRVVRSDGRIGDYAFGTRAKRTLLGREGVPPAALEALAASGVRYLGNEEKRYFCLPTCGGFSHLILENKVRFASARQAFDAGYRPCEDCRPAMAS
jgi:O-6-methylguanine DNA methyltransferase